MAVPDKLLCRRVRVLARGPFGAETAGVADQRENPDFGADKSVVSKDVTGWPGIGK